MCLPFACIVPHPKDLYLNIAPALTPLHRFLMFSAEDLANAARALYSESALAMTVFFCRVATGPALVSLLVQQLTIACVLLAFPQS